jgi:hypothetical protein
LIRRFVLIVLRFVILPVRLLLVGVVAILVIRVVHELEPRSLAVCLGVRVRSPHLHSYSSLYPLARSANRKKATSFFILKKNYLKKKILSMGQSQSSNRNQNILVFGINHLADIDYLDPMWEKDESKQALGQGLSQLVRGLHTLHPQKRDA